MPDRPPSDTLEALVPDEDETMADLSPILDARGPATVEERLSPFHESGATPVATLQGMPSMQSQGFGAPNLGANAVPSVSSEALTFDEAPTDHQGIPLMGLEPHLPPEGPASWGETKKSPGLPAAPPPEVPSPGDPNVLVSKSMQFDLRKVDALGEPREQPVTAPTEAPKVRAASPRARVAAAPTEVHLPALKRKQESEKEGSDLPLIFGLLALGLVIAGIVVLVALGITGHLG